jgi:hypothetical protein
MQHGVCRLAVDSLKIGIRLESLGQPLRRALAEAARLRGPGKLFRLTRPEERGIAYGTRVLRRRSLRSSLRTGEPSTWRRETGGQTTRTSRYARCETPTRFWESIVVKA